MGEANVKASLAAQGQAAGLGPLMGQSRVNAAQTASEAAAAPIAEGEGDARRVTRGTRIPFGNFTQKLAYADREGYRRYWFNDEPGRVHRAREAGYDHVFDPIQKQNVQRIVGRNESGGPLLAFLMEIPQEWFEEDMAQYQKIVDEKEAAYKRGQVEALGGADSQAHFRPESQGRRIQISTPRK